MLWARAFILIISCLSGRTGMAQQRFDVVSVKPSADARASFRSSSDGLYIKSHTLKGIIQMAYSVKDFETVGPDWLATERYDIIAKAEGRVQNKELMLMLQAVLADRFRLVAHREMRELSVYGLLASKSGPKVHSAEHGGDFVGSNGPGRSTLWCCIAGMATLASILSHEVG
jgi:uncharacterized protein (TIGR03435 family)